MTDNASEVTFVFSAFSRNSTNFLVTNNVDGFDLNVALTPESSVMLNGYLSYYYIINQ